jgi:hypothetical protein
MAASAAVPGLFFCFAATVLLVFASVSAPTWNSISFLNVGGGPQIRYGIFGYTGSEISIGYYFIAPAAFDDGAINTTFIHNLTKTLILHPIAAALSGFAVLFGICGASYHRTGTVFMALCAFIATVVTFVTWIIDMVLFGIVRDRFRDQSVPAQFGNANWLTLGALVALLLSACTGVCGAFGSYRRKNY